MKLFLLRGIYAYEGDCWIACYNSDEEAESQVVNLSQEVLEKRPTKV